MRKGDIDHSRSILGVQRVGKHGWEHRPPQNARTDERSRKHFTDVALFDQVSDVTDDRRSTRLESNRAAHLFILRELRELDCFGNVAAERPFTVHGLPRFQGRADQFKVVRNFHRYHDEVEIWKLQEIQVALKRIRDPKFLRSLARELTIGVRQRYKFIVGTCLQCRDVGCRRPTLLWMYADHTNFDFSVFHLYSFLTVRFLGRPCRGFLRLQALFAVLSG